MQIGTSSQFNKQMNRREHDERFELTGILARHTQSDTHFSIFDLSITSTVQKHSTRSLHASK